MAHIGNFRWAVMMNIATSPFLPTLALRRFLLKRIGINLPSSSYIAAGTTLVSNKITIGEHVLINSQCFLDGAGPIYIEDYVRIGAKVCIITGTHDIENSAIRVDRLKPTVPKAVRIGRGSWLGANVTVLPGVTIGEGCVVAAGAVVTKDLEPHNLYAGIPARQIRALPQDEATLLEMPRMEQLEFLPPPVTDYDVIGSNLASPA